MHKFFVSIAVFILLLWNLDVFSQDASSVYKNTVNSTVTIETNNGTLGSGFFVAPNIIATNYHVIKGCDSAVCYLNNSTVKYKIEGFVAKDVAVDLILLKVTTLNKPAVKIAMNSVSVGQKIFVIGSPKGLSASISDGIVSGMRDFDGYKLIQMTAPISPGSSGGPVLNLNGELIGISVLQINEGQNLNFAIPKSYLQILLDFKSQNPSALSTLNESNKENVESNDSDLTESDALEFIKYYSNEWACEKYAKGTFEKRLQYALISGKLIIWEYFPSSDSFEFAKQELDLSKIEMISFESGDGCSPILVKYGSGGYKVSFKIRNDDKIIELSASDNFEMSIKNGFTWDSIRLTKNIDQQEHAERLIKAIRFLAVKYGAKIKESGF